MPEPFSLDYLELEDDAPYKALLERCPEARLRRYGDGEVLVAEGAESSEVYLLLRGACVVESAGAAESGGRAQSLGIIEARPGAPAFVGEMATLRGGMRSASVRCSGAVFAVVLPPESLDVMMDELPFFTRCLCRQFALRLQEANQLIKDYQQQIALDAELAVRQPGEAIFEKGQRADSLFQLVEGTVRLGDRSVTAAQLRDGFLEPEAYFRRGAYQVTATADGAAMVVAISSGSMEAVVRRYPGMVVELWRG